MSAEYYILDKPLPPSEDFNGLKAGGLAFIQEHMTNNWTNLNPSDPGITILDQLCYAMTELGYCNNFSIADILTRPDGTLQVNDQFYLPEDILTSSPVTIDDFRKYVIDGVQCVANADVQAVKEDTGINGVYQTVLFIDETAVRPAEFDPCRAAFFCLNRCRNLNERFLYPVWLKPVTFFLCGTIDIKEAKDAGNIISAMQKVIQDMIFPKVTPRSYSELTAKNFPINEIFNGPQLKKGWIPTGSLGELNRTLTAIDVARAIRQIPGVVAVSDIFFAIPSSGEKVTSVSTAEAEIPVIAVYDSAIQSTQRRAIINTDIAKLPYLTLICKGRAVTIMKTAAGDDPTDYASGDSAGIMYGASSSEQTVLPKGTFRDINSYYSIQHTFPEIFRVGADAVSDDASPYEIAQSRQLKGYLALYDQVLANQFSQLANLPALFSFKNTMSNDPSDKKGYYESMDSYEKEHQQYPVPYTSFSPTYYCQSLYGVPDIRPLLKDNYALAYGTGLATDSEIREDSWKSYKLDPYNSYIHGLMDLMGDETINLARRNDMLDHLLARHGESSLVIDTIINGSVYSGDSAKDKVIFKSLYLQNFALLSYYRNKAFNYTAATELYRSFSGSYGEGPEGAVKALHTSIRQTPSDIARCIFNGLTYDFIFDSGKIDSVERLTQLDFTNFSAVELKLCLLFGLKNLYYHFIAERIEQKEKFPGKVEEIQAEIDLAMWLIRHRRGMIMIETSLISAASGGKIPSNQLLFLFPGFMPTMNTTGFRDRVDFFLRNELPPMVPFTCYYIDVQAFSDLVYAYTAWHDCMLYENGTKPDAATVRTRMDARTARLNNLLEPIISRANV